MLLSMGSCFGRGHAGVDEDVQSLRLIWLLGLAVTNQHGGP